MLQSISKALIEYKKYPGLRDDYIIVVDFSLPSNKKRLFLVDLKTNNIVQQHYTTHGSGSSCYLHKELACSFSNKIGSHKSSLGAMKTDSVYVGRHGKSLRLDGLEKGVNSLVRMRSIVIHSAVYASESYIHQYGRAGCSWGCFVLDPDVYSKFIDLVKGGTFLYSYHS